MRRRFLLSAGLLAVAFAAVAGCDNMKHQSSLRPMDPTDRLPRGTAAQSPPDHTVAHGRLPAGAFTTGRKDGQLVATAPIAVSPALLARGRERFDIYCAVCHGRDGYGTGIVVRRGFPPPPSFHGERLRAAPIGHFFDVITHGHGVMYSYADRIDVHDRWAIALYIRALQRSQHATTADVPPGRLAELSPP